MQSRKSARACHLLRYTLLVEAGPVAGLITGTEATTTQPARRSTGLAERSRISQALHTGTTMDQNAPMDFYCMTCNARFFIPLFDVTRAIERVHFYPAGRLPEVEITHAEGFGVYCSVSCRAQGLPALMAAEQVPLPEHPPGIGPVEVCARCSGPVDTAAFHLTYSQCEIVYGEACGQASNLEYLAVVCDRCSDGDFATAEPVRDLVTIGSAL